LVRLAEIAFVLALASPASAQSRSAEALEQYRAANFEAAIEIARTVLSGEGESSEAVATALEVLVLSYLGEGRDEPAFNALRALSIVAREHGFLPETPPDVVERHRALVEAQARLALFTEATNAPDRVELSTRLEGAGTDLVSAILLHVRVGDGEWRVSREGRQTLAGVREPIAYYARALGPGGVVLANVGSEREPLIVTAEAAPIEEGPSAWIFVGIGAGLAALIGIVVAVVIVARDEQPIPVDGPFLR
jgi:hypothetical protein